MVHIAVQPVDNDGGIGPNGWISVRCIIPPNSVWSRRDFFEQNDFLAGETGQTSRNHTVFSGLRLSNSESWSLWWSIRWNRFRGISWRDRTRFPPGKVGTFSWVGSRLLNRCESNLDLNPAKNNGIYVGFLWNLTYSTEKVRLEFLSYPFFFGKKPITPNFCVLFTTSILWNSDGRSKSSHGPL